MSDRMEVQVPNIGNRLERQRRSGLLSICCALSVVTIIGMVPPLGKIERGLLINGPEWFVILGTCLIAIALIASLYFFLAVVLHLMRSRMGAAGKTIWGICLLFGGTLTAIIYFMMAWSIEERG